MTVVATDAERYSSPSAFAREVNLPLLGSASLAPVAAGASLTELLSASTRGALESIVENLAQTRQSLTLRSLLLAGFPHDPECFALGLALGRAWSRRGLKVAIVDLDAWSPTIVRGIGEPAEGLTDVLEYGCSFQRVAWEVVAGSLWVVGPGTHPIEEARLADHPEWERAARAFATRADVTLYVAPFLRQRPGLTGRLSKRMDGVVLTSSIDRVSRVELRDAFLELWGSDAPIIGCVAIEPATSTPTAAPSSAGIESMPVPQRTEAAPAPAAEPDAGKRVAERVVERVPRTPRGAVVPDEGESELVAALEREVRSGGAAKGQRRSSTPDWLWRGLAATVIALAGVAAWMAFVAPPGRLAATSETRGTGEESVLPAPESTTPEETTPVAAGLAAGASAPTVGAAPPTGAPSAAPPPVAGKDYRVHVASFRSEEKVVPIVQDLRLKGLDAWFEPAPDGSGWYRVFVGRFATEAEAASYASWLLRNKWVDRAHAFPSTSR